MSGGGGGGGGSGGGAGGGGGGGQKRRPGATKGQGWEEAGAEFYQERYPQTGDAEQLDPKHLATLLPSKQTRAATMRIRTADGTRTLRSEYKARQINSVGLISPSEIK